MSEPLSEAKILEKIIELLMNQFGLPNTVSESITAESTFVDLCLDELDKIELVMGLEEEFDIEIPDEDAEQWETVGDALKCLQRIMV